MKKLIHDEVGIDLPVWFKEIMFDFPRDLNKLHSLNLPVEKIAIEDLTWHLDMPFFWQTDNPFSLKPREVLNTPELYEYRMNRILNVDTSYPVDIMWWKGRWQILDGLHRLSKLVVQGESFVLVRKVPVDLRDLILPD